MMPVRRFWHAQCALFDGSWVAGFGWWGAGVTGWSLWHWAAPSPLPLVTVLLVCVMVLSPLIRFVLAGLAEREPQGQRGQAWTAWYLATQFARPPLSSLARMLDILAQLLGPLLLAMALMHQHLGLIVIAVTPLLWRVSFVRMLAVHTKGVQ